jgi:mannose-6-phosphate isomerase
MEFTLEPYQQRVEKPWGFEIILNPPEAPFTGKIMSVQAGKRWSLHYHDQKQETICLFSGKALLWVEDTNGNIQKVAMEPQKGYFITPGQKHRVEALEDTLIFEASMPEIGTTVRLEDDYARKNETETDRIDPNRGWQTLDSIKIKDGR